jgi:hypothetical protein
LNGTLTFTLTHANHTIIVDDGFPDGYYGLYGYAINGVLKNLGRKVPLDVAGNVDVRLESDFSDTVEIVHAWCVNTRLHLDGLGSKGKLALWDEAYFGTHSNITVGSGVTFAAYNAYHNREGRLPVPVPRFQLRNSLLVIPDADFEVNDFQLERDKTATVVVQYSLSKLPKVVLSSAAKYDNILKELKLEHIEPSVSFQGEGNLLEGNLKAFERLEYKIVCGRNLNCGKWKVSLVGEEGRFGGKEPVVQAKCVKTEGSDESCIVLSVVKKPGIFWTVIMFTYIGIALAILIGDILYCMFSPRVGYPDEVDPRMSVEPLLSKDNLGGEE